MKSLNSDQLQFWHNYLDTLTLQPVNPIVHAAIAGNIEIADQLLELYLSGRKTASSTLAKDYEVTGDAPPKVGNFWIILNCQNAPKCIVKTIRVERYKFDQVPLEVAIAEGEGDLSLEYWRRAHIEFFTPYLKDWGVANIDEEILITEFFEIVYR